MRLRTRVVLGAASAGLAATLLTAAATGGSDGTTPGRGPVVSAYDEALIHGAYDMTQYMGRPDATGAMFDGLLVDEQLRLSRDPAFVAQLEQHQADIDRMLGRGAP